MFASVNASKMAKSNCRLCETSCPITRASQGRRRRAVICAVRDKKRPASGFEPQHREARPESSQQSQPTLIGFQSRKGDPFSSSQPGALELSCSLSRLLPKKKKNAKPEGRAAKNKPSCQGGSQKDIQEKQCSSFLKVMSSLPVDADAGL